VKDLQDRIAKYNTLLGATIESDMASQQQHAAKNEMLTEIVAGVKADLKYAEFVARKTPEKLAGFGWAARRSRVAQPAPGEVRDIQMGKQGDTWLTLSWNPPVDGGIPSAYQIQRSQGTTGIWEEAGTSAATEHVLTNQPRGVQLSYRVMAVNKAGTDNPSGVVQAVL